VPGGLLRGRLQVPAAAPEAGERVERLVAAGNVVVEQILSGRLEAPVDYEQEQDEWVLLLAGGAVLAVEDESIELASGDWLYLPAGLPHRLMDTQPGTSWIAVHLSEHAAPG
jgi:cupin 2 domain-containing protein